MLSSPLSAKSSAPSQRKALILLTDGEENSSAHDEINAIASAEDADVLLDAIRYTETQHNRPTADSLHGIAALNHMTQQTGGTSFDALHTNLDQDFTQIEAELRSLYSISYYSTHPMHDGGFRKVVIRARVPGLTVRARAGYYAK